MSRQGVYNWLARHPELEEVRKEAEDSLLDIAEGHVHTFVVNGDAKMIRWFLDRKGKDRGYTTRVESTGADGGPVSIETITRTIVDPDEEAPE